MPCAHPQGGAAVIFVRSVFLVLQAAGVANGPATVVQSATRAVEHDSVARASTLWQAALARDSADLGARLGLATIARLTYDFAAADRHYAAIEARAPASGTAGARENPRPPASPSPESRS